MAIHVTSSDTTSSIVAQTSGDIWLLQAGVYVMTSGTAFNSMGDTWGKAFFIDGAIVTETYGIFLGGGTEGEGGDNKVTIGRTGSIHAETEAITSTGGQLTVTNYGHVTAGYGASDGFTSTSGEAVETGGGGGTVINHGTMASISQSAPVLFMASGSNYVENHGIIRGRGLVLNEAAIVFNFGTPTVGNEVVNKGFIYSRNAIQGTENAREQITNSGDIFGTTYLKGGNDSVINSGMIDGYLRWAPATTPWSIPVKSVRR